MSRIYAPVDDPTLSKIDESAKEKGISRAQWVCTAINAYLDQGGADIDNLRRELVQVSTERDQAWRETVQLRREKDQLSTEAEQLRSTVAKLKEQIEQQHSDSEGCKDELARCKTESEKIKEAMRLKEEEVAFLRGHVSQLTQSISQLSLPPSQEEAKAKHWWQFWR